MTTLPAYKGRSIGALGAAAGITNTLSPTDGGISGTAAVAGDTVFLILTSSSDTANTRFPVLNDPGWRTVVTPGTVGTGTMTLGVYARTKGAETGYSATWSAGSQGAYYKFVWYSGGHTDIAQLILGTAGLRNLSGGTTLLNVPGITTLVPNTKVIMIAADRTVATETAGQVTYSNGFTLDTEWLNGNDNATIAATHKDMVAAGATGQSVVTYPNTHAQNAKGIQIGLPPKPDPLPSAVLLGEWPFSDSLSDTSGNAHHATANWTPSYAAGPAANTRALRFPTVAEGVVSPQDCQVIFGRTGLVPTTLGVTSMAWMKGPPVGTGYLGQLPFKSRAADSSRFGAYINPGGYLRWVTRWKDDLHFTESGPIVADNTWHHVCVVDTDRIWAIYVDGVRVEYGDRAFDSSEWTIAEPYDWGIGRDPLINVVAVPDTLVADARIFQGALTDAEVVVWRDRHTTTAGLPIKVSDGTQLKDSRLMVSNGTALYTPRSIKKVKFGYASVTEMLSKRPVFVAHRGGSRDYPEMSGYAYGHAALGDYPALEISLARTSDGVWFGLHDASLDRTSLGTGGGSGTTLTASAMTWAQVQTYSILGSTAVTNPTQPNRPYLRFEELMEAYYASHVIFVDPKAAMPYRAELLAKMDAMPGNPRERFVGKYFGFSGNATNTTGWARDLADRGYQSWGYFYSTDLANFAAYAPRWSILGMDYSSPQADWDALRAAAPGKPVLAHVVPTTAALDQAKARSADGYMVSGVQAISPVVPSGPHRVFPVTPPGTVKAWDDGTPNIRLGSYFYTLGPTTVGWRCIGARIYIPAGSAASNMPVTIHAYLDTSGVTPPTSNPAALVAAPIRSASITTPASGWTEVFWTPFLIQSAMTNLVFIGYEFSGAAAGVYLHAPGLPPDAQAASDGSKVYLAENAFRSYFNQGGAGWQQSSAYYGSDLIVDEG